MSRRLFQPRPPPLGSRLPLLARCPFTLDHPTGSNVTASFPIAKVGTRDIESATLYLGYTQFVDNSNQFTSAFKGAADLTNLGQPVSLSVAIPANIKGPIYARIAVKTQGINERIFSPVQKIEL